MRPAFRSIVPLLLLALPCAAVADWPHLRGPTADGRADAPGTFPAEDVGLEVAWRVPLGSGYSGIAVSGGRAVTAWTDGTADWVGAFDAASGASLWKHRLGDVHKGHDGSDDGPLSTPTVAGGRVFALGPDGNLIALALEDGKPAWTTSLPDAFSSPAPHFGFTSTPLHVGGHLVVQAGGPDGRSIVALDPATGELRWGAGSGAVNYQSPVAMTVGDGEQIVAFDAERLVGLDPADGSVLWSRPFAEGERAPGSPAVPMGDGRFLVAMAPGVVAFRAVASEDGWTVEELYRSNVLGGGYALPVVHDGHVYGFRGSVLACMDAATGERTWRSRPPGGDGLILVDGHLVVFGAKGTVVVAEATPEGYRERARVEALGGSSLTWPSFAEGRVFVRNLEEMAAVAVRRGPVGVAGSTDAAGGLAGDHAFSRFVRSLEDVDDPNARIDAFLAEHPGGPVVDGDRVTLVWRGKARDVAVSGPMVVAGDAEPMHRVPGTDLFHRTYRVEPGGRLEYRFQVDFGEWVPDPRNPATVPAIEGDGVLSEFRTEGYGAPPSPPAADAPSGTVETFTLASESLGREKEIRVWLPPGYAGGEDDLPLLVVHDGDAWIDKGGAIETLDRLVGDGAIRPVVVAFVPAARAWWLESGGSQTEEYVAMIAEELVPALEQRYRLLSGAASRTTLGNRFYGFAATYTALSRPGTFGTVVAHSPAMGLGSDDALMARIEARSAPETRFRIDWNRWDERNDDRGWDFAESARTLARRMDEAGYGVNSGERLDCSGWGGWRQRLPEVLAATFPPRGS